jgi:hypothetical protein
MEDVSESSHKESNGQTTSHDLRPLLTAKKGQQ